MNSFRKTVLIATGSFGLLFVVWFLLFVVVYPSDLKKYQAFLDNNKISSTKSLSSTTNQKRQGVRKDIWFTQDDLSRLHYRIESEHSILTLVPEGNSWDVIENLEKIKCWMQDKLYFADANHQNMQQVRYFEADQGSYQFKLQQFDAKTVALSLFRLPGHHLSFAEDPKSAFLKGVAQDVSFSVAGKTPQFQAQHFKAFLKPREAKSP
jgi:hypothetical protein